MKKLKKIYCGTSFAFGLLMLLLTMFAFSDRVRMRLMSIIRRRIVEHKVPGLTLE